MVHFASFKFFLQPNESHADRVRNSTDFQGPVSEAASLRWRRIPSRPSLVECGMQGGGEKQPAHPEYGGED